MTINGLQEGINEANSKIAEAQAMIATSGEATPVRSDVLEQAETIITEQEAIKKEKQKELDSALSQKRAALSNLEASTIAGIESSIITNQQYLVTNQGAQDEVKRALSNIKSSGVSDTIESVRQTEIQEIMVEINACQENEKELKNVVETINKQMEKFVIKAPISGTINLIEDLVEATIDETDFYNQNGESVDLKPGMLCEAKIIVEQKSVLNYLLEKINF